MQKFLIEVPHDADRLACTRAVQTLLETGSHFMTNADFGCLDGEHKAWIIVEVENKEVAQAILPAEFRSKAKIVQLNKFSLDKMDEFLKHHKD